MGNANLLEVLMLSNGIKRALLLCALMLLSLMLTLPCLGEENASLPDNLSPAMHHLSEEFPLIKVSLKGQTVAFHRNDFEQCLGVDRVGSVMISSLPSAELGELRLGDLPVTKNQILSGSELKRLSFVPRTQSVSEASFRFRVMGSQEYILSCQIYFLEKLNDAPTAEKASKAMLTQCTMENIAIHGRMHALDPENDLLRFEIVKNPKKGIVSISNRELGDYVYTPIKDFVGEDRFVYRVIDRYGNRSEDVTVTIQVKNNEAAVVYSDLIGHEAHYAALRLTDAGITDVRYEGGNAVFHSDEKMTRLDFLVMAMQSAGYRVSTTVESTSFTDDDRIPAEWKGYVSAAVNMGFISGIRTESGLCFRPDSPITRADAAVIVSRMIDLGEPTYLPVFSDSDDIPVYAKDSIASLTAAGILTGNGMSIAPTDQLLRGQAARLLCGLMDYMESSV